MISITDMIGSLIMFYANIYVWSKLLNKKINYKSPKFYIVWISLSIISILNSYVFTSFVKVVILTIIYMIFIKILFNINQKKAIITPLYSQMLVMISEAICILLIVSFLKLDVNQLKEQYIETIIVNIIISFIYLIFANLKFVQKLYNSLLKSIEKVGKKFLIFFSMIIIVVANVLSALTYYEVDIRLLIIINISFTLICVFIVFYSFKIQNNYNKVSDEYNVAINSLNDYENMMTKYRIDSHENKNLLLTIRAMIVNKEKDIPKFIDSFVEEKYNDSEKLLQKMNIIPSGGLRATIYSEVLKIKNKNINYSLNIDQKLKAVDLIRLDTETIIDVCKIIGVLIDNAIDEVINLAEGTIDIQLYVEDEKLNIKISNNYNTKILVDKIYDDGYTTKGMGHGYGLPLVKKIVDDNRILTNKIELSEKVFSQIISINYDI